METPLEELRRLLHAYDNWHLAWRVCELVGEKDPSWVRAIAHALDIGDVPALIYPALRKLKETL